MDIPSQSWAQSDEVIMMETINSLPEEFSDLFTTLEKVGYKAAEERQEHLFTDPMHQIYHEYPSQITDLITEVFHASVTSVRVTSTPPHFEVTIVTDRAGTFIIHQEEGLFWLENDSPLVTITESLRVVDTKEMGRLFESLLFEYDHLVDIDSARRSRKATEIDLHNVSTALLINQTLEASRLNSTMITKRYQFTYPSSELDPKIAVTFDANVSNEGSTAFDMTIHLDNPDGGHCLLKVHYDSHHNQAVNFLVDGSLWRGDDFDSPEQLSEISVALYVEEVIKRMTARFRSGEDTSEPL